MSSIFDWSLTASSNSNADSSINWQEGQLPSTVNNSARAMMTRVAQFLKDMGGTVTSGGTANAVTLTANSPFTAYATGQIVGFKASATNTGAATLNVNGIGAKAIRKQSPASDTALVGGEIISGGLYILAYDAALNSAAGAWVLLNPNYGVEPFVSLASAATTDLSTVSSQNVTVTGTTTIAAFGTAAAGTFRRLVFSGILTLTHNATSLILPQGGNVVTAAGDSLEAVSLGSGNWRVTSYQKVSAGTGLISGTAVSASGTSVDFTSIPSWVKRITISLESLSTNGSTGVSLQLGDSGGIETTGYVCATGNAGSSTTEFPLTGGSGAAAAVYQGVIFLTLMNAATNLWCVSSQVARTDTSAVLTVVGSKSTSAVLDRVRLKSGNGTDTFDAGSINILYE